MAASRMKISQEIQPTWDAINWQYGQNLWVQVDTQHKRILVGVPMGSATQPNQILMLDYTEGFGDPLVAMLDCARALAQMGAVDDRREFLRPDRARPPASRRFSSARIIPAAKFMRLRPAQFSDDGAAINSFYSTAFLAATARAQRHEIFSATSPHTCRARARSRSRRISPGDVASIALGAWTLGSPASRDMEQFTNVLAERVSYQFGTNAAGSWFSLTKFAPWAKPDPFAIVRGTN